jgi:DNA-binding CsgD family transcriptional regulator/tetratricopeptide (TPR) repeat protein
MPDMAIGRDPGRHPLIGREVELARLVEAARLDSTGGLIVVSGDAGIGKTRLLAELEATAASLGWVCAVGHCVGQAGVDLPYLPFSEIVSALEHTSPDVVERVRATFPGVRHLLPAAPDAPGAPAEGGASGAQVDVGAVSTPATVVEGVHALLTAVGAVTPILVLVEDVHWADHSSRDLLTLLFTRGFTTRVTLVASYRSDDLHRRHPLHETLPIWSRLPAVTRIDLGPLSEPQMRTLVGGLSGAPTDRDQIAALATRAEGNPFYAEELVATSSNGAVRSDDLDRLLRLRIEHLDPSTQRVLRSMSTACGVVPHALLDAALGLPADDLEAALRQGIDHHVIQARRTGYAFRHALLGEAIADDLLPGERVRLHAAYAAALAARPLLGTPADLARHASAAGDIATAITAGIAAGDAALAMGGPHDALRHFEGALLLMDAEHPDRERVTVRAARAASLGGAVLRSVQLLRDRLDHPGTQVDAGDHAELLAALAMQERIVDLPTDGLALTAEAVALLPPAQDARRVRVLVARAQALVDARRYAEATAVADEATALADRLGLVEEVSEIRMIMARAMEDQLEPEAVETHLCAAVDELRGTSDPAQIRAFVQLGGLAHRRGDLETAARLYGEGAAIAARLDRPFAPWGMECRLYGGLVAYERGLWDDAITSLTIEAEPVGQPGLALFEAARLTVLAARGEAPPEGATARLRPWWEVDGLAAVLTSGSGAEILAHAGRLDDAVALAAAALRLLEELWGLANHAAVRICAQVIGLCADAAAGAGSTERARLRRTGEEFYAGVERRDADPSVTPPGAEGVAWRIRAHAEILRLRWLAGEGGGEAGGDAAEDLLRVWRSCVEHFERYGHVYETARSRARLAAVLAASGEVEAARAEAAAAYDVASRLSARPLLVELEALGVPSARSVPSFPSRHAGLTSGQAALTPRELEVLRLVALGQSNGQIGKRLFISTKTVSVHVSNAMAKLGAHSRGEAVALAHREGLV